MYLEQYIKGEIEFNIENIVNDIGVEDEKKQLIEEITDYDIQEICDRLLNSNYFMETLNGFVNENIESEIYHYIDEKRGVDCE